MRLDVRVAADFQSVSRSRAAALINEGCVTVNGKTVTRPAFSVEKEDTVALLDSPLCTYVSRGGLKLHEALRVFAIDPRGCIALDVGASTGGFTDCLLKHGAAAVISLDVGKDQLHPALRSDDRVTVLEQTDLRDFDPTLYPAIDLITVDVSFISQRLLYPRLAAILPKNGDLITLIKPQFEMDSRRDLGKGGIVKDQKKIDRAIERLIPFADAAGLRLVRIIPSPITGGDGNREFLAHFRRKS